MVQTQGQTSSAQGEGPSMARMTKDIERSYKATYTFLTNPKVYHERNLCWRKRKITPAAVERWWKRVVRANSAIFATQRKTQSEVQTWLCDRKVWCKIGCHKWACTNEHLLKKHVDQKSMWVNEHSTRRTCNRSACLKSMTRMCWWEYWLWKSTQDDRRLEVGLSSD